MKILKYISFTALILMVGFNLALAAESGGDSVNLSDIDPLGDATLMDLINRIVNFAIGLIIAISVLFIIYAAYLFMFAGGDPKNVTQAKAIITYTVIAI